MMAGITYLQTADKCNNSNTFQEIRCKTSKYKNSFFPDSINLWNNIITNFKNVPHFASLKAHILSLIRPKAKSTFAVHDPLGLRYIFQLRMNLSPLRNHKRRHNFAGTPFEIGECNQHIEGTSHFVFTYPRFANHRTVIEILRRINPNHLGNQLELYLYYPVVNNKIYKRHPPFLNLSTPPSLFPPRFVTIVFDLLFLSYYYCIVEYIPCCFLLIVYFWFAVASA